MCVQAEKKKNPSHKGNGDRLDMEFVAIALIVRMLLNGKGDTPETEHGSPRQLHRRRMNVGRL